MEKVNQAIKFYQIDLKHHEELYECANWINRNKKENQKFWDIFEVLLIDNSEKYREFQSLKNASIDDFFVKRNP